MAVLGNERIKYILHVVWNKSIVEYVDDSKMENFVILWPGAVNSYNLEIANASIFRVIVNLEDCAKEQDILACWLKALAKEKDVLHIAINRRIDVSLDVDEEIFRLLKEIVKKNSLDSYVKEIHVYINGFPYNWQRHFRQIVLPEGYHFVVGSTSDSFMFLRFEDDDITTYDEFVSHVAQKLPKKIVGEKKVNAMLNILDKIKPRVIYREDEVLGLFLLVGPP